MNIDLENLEQAQAFINASWTAMEKRSEEFDAEKKNGKWPKPITRGKFTMTKEIFIPKFGNQEIVSKISNDPFDLVDLLEAIYEDRDESSTTWKISRLLLYPEDVNGMDMMYLSNRGGIFSILDNELDPKGMPRFISLKCVIRYFKEQE